jgi:uncharacterized YigZ family protein
MEKGSKFHAYASPIANEAEGMQFIQALKKDHPKARHHCYALRLHPDSSLERANDDGEPSGSAGKPILGQIVKLNLTNVMVVVVRYFGGTQLGIPGLIEAYKTSAADALGQGMITRRTVLSKVKIQMPYDKHPHFLNYCKTAGIPVLYEEFGEKASITIAFHKSTIEEELKSTLRAFSQLDFVTIKDYAEKLGFSIDFTTGDLIL